MEFQARWPTPHSPMATKWHRGAKFNKEPNDFFFKFNNLRALNGCKGLPWRSSGLSLPYNAGDMGLIPGLGRSPGEGNGYHSSILAWRIPWKEEPGKLQPMGSQRVRHA